MQPLPEAPAAAIIDLRFFFDRSFAPLRLARCSAPGLRLYRDAIAALARAVGHRPSLADLNGPALADTWRIVAKRPSYPRFPGSREKVSGKQRAQAVGKRLRAMARHAHELGLIPELPAPRNRAWAGDNPAPATPEFLASPPGRGTLSAGLQPFLRRRRGHAAAVRRFNLFLGRYATAADLTDETLARFRDITGQKFERYAARLREVAFPKWRPARSQPERAPRPAFLEAPPGLVTLWAAFLALRPSLARKRSRKTVTSYGTAVRQFDALLSRYSTPADVTPRELARFRDSIRARGRSDALYMLYAARLRCLARAIVPEQFPTRNAGKMPQAAAGTVRRFYEQTYVPERLTGCTARSQVDYARTFRKLHKFLGRDLRLSELTDKLAAEFFNWLLAAGLRAVTVNTHRGRLFAMWRLAADRGLVAAGPKVRKLREALDAPDSWDEREMGRIIEAPLSMTWRRPVAGIPAGEFWRALLLVAYWTGLRRGSLLKLRTADVDLASGWLAVTGGSIKNRRGQRFRLGADAIEALRAIAEPARELLFPCPHRDNWFSGQFRRIVVAAGVSPSTRSNGLLHKLRRTVATLAAVNRGLAAASELLGHSGTEVTKRYIDPAKLPGRDATEFLPVLRSAGIAKCDDARGTADRHDVAGDAGSTPGAPTSPAMVDVATTAGNGEGRSTVTELDVASHECAPDPHQLLRDAARLLKAGDGLFAAAGCRMALERWLCDFGQAVDCTPGRGQPRGVTARARLLRDAELLPHRDFADIRRVNKSANRAAHGCRVGPKRVAEMLDTLGRLFRDRPAAIATVDGLAGSCFNNLVSSAGLVG